MSGDWLSWILVGWLGLGSAGFLASALYVAVGGSPVAVPLAYAGLLFLFLAIWAHREMKAWEKLWEKCR